MAKSLASVKPWTFVGSTDIGLTLARYRHIWRVYRCAVAWDASLEEGGRKYATAQDALFAAIAAAKKAGVK